MEIEKESINIKKLSKAPTSAYMGASFAAITVGLGAYFIGLWNAAMDLREKGYYFTVLILGLFSVISLQKTIRDKEEGIPVTNAYLSLCWVVVFLSIALMAIGLWNALLTKSEKGFYGISFLFVLFSSMTIQKNIRDSK